MHQGDRDKGNQCMVTEVFLTLEQLIRSLRLFSPVKQEHDPRQLRGVRVCLHEHNVREQDGVITHTTAKLLVTALVEEPGWAPQVWSWLFSILSFKEVTGTHQHWHGPRREAVIETAQWTEQVIMSLLGEQLGTVVGQGSLYAPARDTMTIDGTTDLIIPATRTVISPDERAALLSGSKITEHL
jgi:hypothetical protein